MGRVFWGRGATKAQSPLHFNFVLSCTKNIPLENLSALSKKLICETKSDFRICLSLKTQKYNFKLNIMHYERTSLT